ncbi:MAG: hypothetical protein ACREV6_19390 [Clostridium sp.]|uniref:hypothetical protein n=1 Tax=Clostridium sp. TaxID=1506 RepID=UPI003D6C9C64
MDYVQEIIQKSKMYDESRINELMENFGDLFLSENELYRTIFGNYIINEDLGKRPLAKLTKDICGDLGLKFK